jgi:hypothetical protein
MFPGSSRFLEGRLEGGSVAGAGGPGWGGLNGLSLGHWTCGQGEAPIQFLVQPHSCGLQGPQPPPFRPSSVRLVPSPANEWSGLAEFPASLSADKDREAQRGARQRQAERERDLETQTPWLREDDRGSKQGQMFQHRERQSWGGGCAEGEGKLGGPGRSLFPPSPGGVNKSN